MLSLIYLLEGDLQRITIQICNVFFFFISDLDHDIEATLSVFVDDGLGGLSTIFYDSVRVQKS